MKPGLAQPSRPNRGMALIMTMGFILVAAVILGTLLASAQAKTRNSFRTQIFENSTAGARAMINTMSQTVIYVMQNRPPQLQGNVALLDAAVNAVGAGSIPGYEFIKSTATGRNLSYVHDLGPNDYKFRTINSPGDHWDGYTTTRLDYEVVTAVREDSNNARRLAFPGVALARRVTLDYVPLYQFAIFYSGDMELHPGPVMDIRGPVHSNGAMWLGAQSGINFYEQVSCVGKIRAYNDFTNLNINATSSNPYYKYPLESYNNTGSVKFLNAAGTLIDSYLGSGNALDTDNNKYFENLDKTWGSDAITRWNNRVRDQAMGVRPITPPLPTGSQAIDLISRASASDSQALADQKFENLSDIIISGNPDNPSTIKAKLRDGTQIPLVDSSGKSLTSIGEFFDGQQQARVKTIEVDMANLAARTDIDFTKGGLYVTTTPSATDTWTVNTNWTTPGSIMPAVSIKNASYVPRNMKRSFVVASDRPMYTIGNVNTSNKITLVLASDSITMLSQPLTNEVWTKDSKGNFVKSKSGNTRAPDSTLGVPPYPGTGSWPNNKTPSGAVNALPNAGATTTNAIVVMGQTPSQFGPDGKRITQSGGAHNVMRYLENWSGVTHSFGGSIICLFNSKYASVPWQNTKGYTYYSPPTRSYVWDNSLRDAEPPPGIPMFIVVTEYPFQQVSVDYAQANAPTS